MRALDGENRAPADKQCNELQTENAHLQMVKHELLASNSWRLTAPLRQIARGLRSVGIEPEKSCPAEPDARAGNSGAHHWSVSPSRSPEHMPLIGTLACDTDLKLIAFQSARDPAAVPPDLHQNSLPGHNFERCSSISGANVLNWPSGSASMGFAFPIALRVAIRLVSLPGCLWTIQPRR